MRWTTGTLALLAAALTTAVSSGVPARATIPATPTFTAPSRADDPTVSTAAGSQTYVSEPATIVAADGTRYVAYQGASQLSYTRDGGRTWTHVGGSQPAAVLSRNITGCSSIADVGDVDLTTDRAGTVLFTDLQVTTNSGANGADTGIEPITATSTDRFASYAGTCSAHQPASVDREWTAAWTPPGGTAATSDVYISYHDFSVNTIWANASHDGGRTWSQPVDVINSSAEIGASLCDTVPAGTAIDPRNGWVYVAWLAGSTVLDNAATGCNYTQGAAFSNFFVAVSKDGGATWTDTLAFSGPSVTAPTPSDMSEIFGSVSTDREGGVYITFPAYLGGEYDAYLAYSPPADAAGALHFQPPVKLTAPGIHSSYFVRGVAGDAGRVDVIYLGSPVRNVVVTAQNKLTYNGSNPSEPNCTPEVTNAGQGVRFPGKPCELPASAPWYLYLAQSLDATSRAPTFTNVRLRPDAVHTGDICTLGIFCLPNDDRDLADTNDVKIDASGGAQIAYTDENPGRTHTEIDFQCQTSGPGLFVGVAVANCATANSSVASAPPAAPPARGAPAPVRAGSRGRGALALTGGLPLAPAGAAVLALWFLATGWRRRRRAD
ncbi:MAG: sialidase family protein [Mycobacteriales bacterium]